MLGKSHSARERGTGSSTRELKMRRGTSVLYKKSRCSGIIAQAAVLGCSSMRALREQRFSGAQEAGKSSRVLGSSA